MAHHLLVSLESTADVDADELWQREIDRRSKAIDDGSAQCLPVEDVISSVRNELNARHHPS